MGLREAEARAAGILDHDGEYYKDAFGNMIEGKRPASKTEETYVDANGYIQYLKPDEKAPELSDGLVSWLKTVNVENDLEVREALGPELFFEEKLDATDLWLVGRLEITAGSSR